MLICIGALPAIFNLENIYTGIIINGAWENEIYNTSNRFDLQEFQDNQHIQEGLCTIFSYEVRISVMAMKFCLKLLFGNKRI